MVGGASARWGPKKEKSQDTDTSDDESSSQNQQPAHLDQSHSDAIQWSRDPSNKAKKKKKKKGSGDEKSVDSILDASGPTAVEWSRNPVGSNTKVKKKKSSENKPVASTSDSQDDMPKSQKTKKKKKKSMDTGASNESYEWSRISSSHPAPQNAEVHEDETQLKKKKSIKRLDDSAHNQSLDRSEKSTASRKPVRKTKSTRSVDSTGNHNLDRSEKSTSSRKPVGKTKSTRSVDSTGNHSLDRSEKSTSSRKPVRRAKSTRSVDSAGNHSLARSEKSPTRKPVRKTKSTRSMDSTGNKSLDRSTKSTSGPPLTLSKLKSNSSLHDSTSNCSMGWSATSSVSARRLAKYTPSVDSNGSRDRRRSLTRTRSAQSVRSTQSVNSNGTRNKRRSLKKTMSARSVNSSSSMVMYSRGVDVKGHLASSNHSSSSSASRPMVIQHIISTDHFDDASDQSDSDDSQVKPASHDKGLGEESTRHGQDEQEEPRSRRGVQSHNFHESASSTEISYTEEAHPPPKKRIPKKRRSDPMRIDFSGQLIAATSDDSSQKDNERKLGGKDTASKLRKGLKEKSRAVAEIVKRTSEHSRVAQREESFTSQSVDHQEKLQSILQVLEKFEADLMEEQNILELEKQSLESRVLEQLQKQGELETTLQALEETYQKLKAQFPDPVDKIRNRREMLETENQVLQLRIKRQEETLEKYQEPKWNKSSREIFWVREVVAARPAASSSSLPQSTQQIRFQLMGIEAKMKERDETIEDQGMRRDELMAEIEKRLRERAGGGEIPILQARVTELEKEKEEFMKELTRLRNEGKEWQETKRGHRSSEIKRTLSLEEEEDRADFADMQSILEDDAGNSGAQNQDGGFFGWLFGAQS